MRICQNFRFKDGLISVDVQEEIHAWQTSDAGHSPASDRHMGPVCNIAACTQLTSGLRPVLQSPQVVTAFQIDSVWQ